MGSEERLMCRLPPAPEFELDDTSVKITYATATPTPTSNTPLEVEKLSGRANTRMGDFNQTAMSLQDNISVAVSLGSNGSQLNLEIAPGDVTYFTWFECGLFLLCLTGIVGNCLNLSVLTRRRFRTALNNLEGSANYGLVALAISDLCYCVVVFPHVFLPGISGIVKFNRHVIIILYKIYGIAFINLFQMTSTWIIVIIAINRYIVVKYPLKAKRLIDKRVTLGSLICVALASILFSVPYFLIHSFRRCYTENGDMDYQVYGPWSNEVIAALIVYIRWIWPILASFIPLVLLIYCNVKLIVEIRYAIRQDTKVFNVGRRLHQHKEVESKVTITLMSIVVMYLLLVTPGEIIRYVNPYTWWGEVGMVIAKALNLMQTVNFAFNFLLYCAVNVTFRQTFREMVRPRRRVPSFKTNDDIKTLQSLISQRIVRHGSRSSATL